jgi:NAD dependent epimerase/dehydratase family enzyme
VFPLPAFVVKTVFGEMGDRLLLKGQHVVPKRLHSAGFTFDYPYLDSALGRIFST